VRFRSLVVLTAALACNQAPPDTREWRASDHDHTDNPGANQVVGGPDAGAPELAQHGLNELTLVAWQQNCMRCHGRIGRGDGPDGPRVRAPDLTSSAVQAAMTDEQMMKTLREGKGLMPAFDLPESTLRSLVQLVRLIGKASDAAAARPAPSAAVSTAPPASGKPSGAAPGRPPSTAPRAPGSPPPAAPSSPPPP
jgi:cytochrome c oxidase cbb3-type subunit 3